MAEDRTPRTQETRAKTERKSTWKRQSIIPTPEPKNGVKFRWVRTGSLGQADNMNVSKRFREGYVPVQATDHPELKILSDVGSRFKGNIEIGGLILCAIPQEVADDRTQGQLQEAKAQMDAVDNSYLRESDSRMPVLNPERTSRQTNFGK
jgi:hypothetical protein